MSPGCAVYEAATVCTDTPPLPPTGGGTLVVVAAVTLAAGIVARHYARKEKK